MTARRAALALVGALLVAVALNVVAGLVALSLDLTSEGSATLSTETKHVVAHVRRRIEITAFFARDAVGRVEAATLLERYRRLNRRITFRIVDPTLQPGEAQRLGITESGSAAVQELSGPRKIETAQYTIEIDVTSAIARVLRSVSGTVCFAAGHGERDPSDQDPKGLAQAAGILTSNGYRVMSIDLLAHPSVPPSCDALVVASPTSPLGDAATAAITTYLHNTGKAFVLADPSSDVDPTPVVAPWGISFVHGVVVEVDPNSQLNGDPTSPIVRRYSGASPATRGLGPTFFPRVEGVETHNTGDAGLSVDGIAVTSEISYLDTRDIGTFDPNVDKKGPIFVGASADDSSVASPGSRHARILRTRVLAWGDVDFATNDFIGDASNAKLWLQGIDWLTQPEELVTAVPNFPKLRELKLTAARSRYILMLMAGIVPGLFVIAGGLVWALRRGR